MISYEAFQSKPYSHPVYRKKMEIQSNEPGVTIVPLFSIIGMVACTFVVVHGV